MKQPILIAAALATGALLAGCEPRGAAENESTVDSAAIANDIRNAEAAWVEDWASRDANRVMSHYSEDATLMGAGMDPARGAAQIRQIVGSMVQDPNLQLRFNADRVEVSATGDMAYTRGTYSLTTTNVRTRLPYTERGSYMTIYRRQADGSWKASEDIVSPGAPAAPATPPAG